MFNLAVIDTKTHEIRVFANKNKLAEATFNIALSPSEIEEMRKDPVAFLESVGAAPGILPPQRA